MSTGVRPLGMIIWLVFQYRRDFFTPSAVCPPAIKNQHAVCSQHYFWSVFSHLQNPVQNKRIVHPTLFVSSDNYSGHLIFGISLHLKVFFCHPSWYTVLLGASVSHSHPFLWLHFLLLILVSWGISKYTGILNCIADLGQMVQMSLLQIDYVQMEL